MLQSLYLLHKRAHTTAVVTLLAILSMTSFYSLGNSLDVVSESLQMTEARVPVTREKQYLIDLSIDIQYRENMRQSDYPDFIKLKKDLRDWTDSYDWMPVEGESMRGWENLVSDISIEVIKNYPNINVVLLSVAVFPSATQPHMITYKSRVTRPADPSQPILTDVSLVLPIESYAIEHQGPNVIDLTTEFEYKRGVTVKDYPSTDEIYTLLFKLMEEYPVETDFWETMVKAMNEALLNAYPQFNATDMSMRVYPTASVSYFHSIFCRTERSAL